MVALLVVEWRRHAKCVLLAAFVNLHEGVALEWAVHGEAAGAMLWLVIVQPEVINDFLANDVFVLLVLCREGTVRNGPALMLTTGTWRVHVARRVSLVELIRLMEWSLRSATGILNGSVREVRGDCLLRTDWRDILGQCLRLRGAHSRRLLTCARRRSSQLEEDLFHVE